MRYSRCYTCATAEPPASLKTPHQGKALVIVAVAVFVAVLVAVAFAFTGAGAGAVAVAVGAVHINSWELIILRPVTIPKILAHSFVR